jgi:predicted ArsR family transcriptional regulator
MSSRTRENIIRTLQLQGERTINQLADAVGISPVSVRHHVTSLQAEGLIAVEEARHGVGRPHFLYSLTEKALERFPKRYYRLTNRLLEEIRETMSADQVLELFTGVASAMSDRYADSFDGLPMEERISSLKAMLMEEGFDAEIERRGDYVLIHELSCPYFRIGQSHPEVCTIDQTFIANALAVPVERVTCVLDGDNHCTFSVQIEDEEVLETDE